MQTSNTPWISFHHIGQASAQLAALSLAPTFPLGNAVADELHLAEARVRSLEVTLTYGSPPVTVEPKNLVALLGEGWLCDDVFNAYMNRMKANLSEDGRCFDKGPTCAFVYTHFASNLVAKQLEMASNTEKAATGAFKADMAFIPVMEDEHWYFVVYYPAHRSLVVFESPKGATEK